MLNLSLSGCGFLGIYHIGVISAFREHAPEIIESKTSKIAGCSAGSLVAACALCDCCLGQMVSDTLEMALKARSHALGPLHPSFSIVDILRNGLRRILPVDAHIKCNGRLYVSLTRWRDGKNIRVNNFENREDLIQALICSTFVPCYSGFIPPKFRGVYCWDGGLSDNNPILDENTIVVAPFGGESDICPREESASFYCFEMKGTNIQWSKENFYRLSKALFPPSPQVLKAICFRGYKDAITFLKSRNLLHCSCDRFIREKTSIGSLLGDDLCDYPKYESDACSDELMIESEVDDQIEQYAQTVEPLKYQEMPSPVCDVLDAACADHKESLLSVVYNSQISRAISILFLPWTLPVEFSITFTKKLIELLPKITVPNDSRNIINICLIYLNFLIQKFTNDKYQYHTKSTCKLCLLKGHQIDSNVGGLKFSLCYHGNHTNSQTKLTALSTSTATQPPLHSSSIICNEKNSETNFLLPPKLCARHRLPSAYFSGSESVTTNNSFLARKAYMQNRLRKQTQSACLLTSNSSIDLLIVNNNTCNKRSESICSSSTNEASYYKAKINKLRLDKKYQKFNSINQLQKQTFIPNYEELTNKNENNLIDDNENTNNQAVRFDLGEIVHEKVNKVHSNANSTTNESDMDLNENFEFNNKILRKQKTIHWKHKLNDIKEINLKQNQSNASPTISSSTSSPLATNIVKNSNSFNAIVNEEAHNMVVCDHEAFQTCKNCNINMNNDEKLVNQENIDFDAYLDTLEMNVLGKI